jgi:tellurite resistance protein TerC
LPQALLFAWVQPYHWLVFCAAIVAMLALDLFLLHREAKEMTLRGAAGWTVFWVVLSLLFNALIWYWGGSERAMEYFIGYLVEKSLSMDNIFVLIVIFKYFQVPPKYQYRVLFWGILGAMVLRLIFILAAYGLIQAFDWVLPLFGMLLLYSGIKLGLHDETDQNPENNLVLRFGRKFLRVTPELHGEHFFVRHAGKLMVTPLFLVLLVVESTDVVFAVDSIPAIFGVTQDPFLVFTSNMFAILGLRALYFLLAGIMPMFRYLNLGLSAVLVFIGAKMIVSYFWELHPPHWVSLAVIVGLLAVSIIASIIVTRREQTRGGGVKSKDDAAEDAEEQEVEA